jgi:hypothetical protein
MVDGPTTDADGLGDPIAGIAFVIASGIAVEGGRRGPGCWRCTKILSYNSAEEPGIRCRRAIDSHDRRESVISTPMAHASAWRSARIRAFCRGLVRPAGTVPQPVDRPPVRGGPYLEIAS